MDSMTEASIKSMGAVLVGALISMALWGIGSFQTYYHLNMNRDSKDSLRTKMLVLGVWLLDTAHQVVVAWSVYAYLVIGWGKPDTLNYNSNVLKLILILTAITTAQVELFFINRIYLLNGKKVVYPAFLVILVCARFSMTIAYYARSIKATTWGELAPMHWLTVAFGSLSAILDLILAASMIYLLDRSRTGFKKTNALLSRLILLTLSTGLLSAIVSMAQVILVIVSTHTFIYIGLYIIGAKLYPNSLFASLNARTLFRSQDETDTTAVRLEHLEGKHHHSRGMEIKVDVEVNQDGEWKVGGQNSDTSSVPEK